MRVRPQQLCSLIRGPPPPADSRFADPTEFVQSHPELTPAKLYSEIIGWTLTDEGKEKGGVRGIFRRVDEGQFAPGAFAS